METEFLEDHLRRLTRNFTTRLSEDVAFALGRDLATELTKAHAASPPRHPSLEPAAVPMVDGRPRLDGGGPEGDPAEDLLCLGALLHSLATGEEPEVSWRLDGPPSAPLSTLARRAVLAGLTSPRPDGRFPTASAAAEALSAALAPEADLPPPWPLFRGDAGRTGARTAAAPPAGVTPLWQAAVGSVVGSPVLTPRLVLTPTADGRLIFLDRALGRRVHEMRLGTALESSPALAQQVLHVGTDDGEVVGVDIVRGLETYRVKLGRLVRSSPLPSGERVFVGVVEGKDAGAVVALDAGKGKPLWKRKLGAVFSSPALAGGRLLVGSDEGSLCALDPEQGTPLWSCSLGGRVRATPAVGKEVAVVGDFSGRLAAVRLADGTVAWTRELGQTIYSSACLSGELCVVGCHDGRVYGLRLATGEPVFQVATRGPVVSSALAAGDRFLIGSTDGDLYLLDGAGRVLARAPLCPEGTESSPAVDGDMLVVGSARGLHALRLTP
jgi:outer membrane protein assembly factor BamB